MNKDWIRKKKKSDAVLLQGNWLKHDMIIKYTIKWVPKYKRYNKK